MRLTRCGTVPYDRAVAWQAEARKREGMLSLANEPAGQGRGENRNSVARIDGGPYPGSRGYWPSVDFSKISTFSPRVRHSLGDAAANHDRFQQTS